MALITMNKLLIPLLKKIPLPLIIIGFLSVITLLIMVVLFFITNTESVMNQRFAGKASSSKIELEKIDSEDRLAMHISDNDLRFVASTLRFYPNLLSDATGVKNFPNYEQYLHYLRAVIREAKLKDFSIKVGNNRTANSIGDSLQQLSSEIDNRDSTSIRKQSHPQELTDRCIKGAENSIEKTRLSAESEIEISIYIPPQSTQEFLSCILKVIDREPLVNSGIINSRSRETQLSVTVEADSGKPVRIVNLTSANEDSQAAWSKVILK